MSFGSGSHHGSHKADCASSSCRLLLPCILSQILIRPPACQLGTRPEKSYEPPNAPVCSRMEVGSRMTQGTPPLGGGDEGGGGLERRGMAALEAARRAPRGSRAPTRG